MWPGQKAACGGDGVKGQGSLEAPEPRVAPCHAPGVQEARVGHGEGRWGEARLHHRSPLQGGLYLNPPQQWLKWPSCRETDGNGLQGGGCTLFRGTHKWKNTQSHMHTCM